MSRRKAYTFAGNFIATFYIKSLFRWIYLYHYFRNKETRIRTTTTLYSSRLEVLPTKL